MASDTDGLISSRLVFIEASDDTNSVLTAVQDTAEKMVTDEQMKNPKPEWGTDIPDSKEGYWYRCMFDEQFPQQCASTVMRWTPKWSNATDPSGRAIDAHDASYQKK